MTRNSTLPPGTSGTLLLGENRTRARIIGMAPWDGQDKQSLGASTGSPAGASRHKQGRRIIEMDSKKEVRSTCYQ